MGRRASVLVEVVKSGTTRSMHFLKCEKYVNNKYSMPKKGVGSAVMKV
jgi:hypothetical protein